MCGVVAAFTSKPISEAPIRRALARMYRRGPDGEGFWQEYAVALGHRRLAILDLDARAEQPMHSACGRFVIVFNGEIYNFKALRADLEQQGVVFRTTSDTEVLLALFAREGEAMLSKLHGMFALAIWDRTARRGFLARDPYGIKPLYIAKIDGGVLVASQVKALLATGLVSRECNALGQAGFWMLGSVPEPHTWYRDIQSLQAGHCAWVEDGRISSPQCWLDVGAAWRDAAAVASSIDDIRALVRSALKESVARHLVSDVPVGVFLSGGIDSGSVAGLMLEAGAQALEGVTIAFDEFEGSLNDEAPVAEQIAKHYGIRHIVRRVTRSEFRADLPRILEAMDQPSIDGINTWYASKAVAERGLKVVVSGVGGDELFQGYSSFNQLPKLVSRWASLSRIPGAMNLAQAGANWQAARSGNGRWRHAPDWLRSVEGAWWLRRSVHAPDEQIGLSGIQRIKSGEVFDVARSLRTMTGPLPVDSRLALGQIESMTYMRNQLLRDSDWASMDHSVELRTPLVDAHLLNQVQPLLANFYQFPGKSLLAGAPDRPLPSSVIKRKKTGFGIPVSRWLRVDGSPDEKHQSDRWMRTIIDAYEGAA